MGLASAVHTSCIALSVRTFLPGSSLDFRRPSHHLQSTNSVSCGAPHALLPSSSCALGSGPAPLHPHTEPSLLPFSRLCKRQPWLSRALSQSFRTGPALPPHHRFILPQLPVSDILTCISWRELLCCPQVKRIAQRNKPAPIVALHSLIQDGSRNSLAKWPFWVAGGRGVARGACRDGGQHERGAHRGCRLPRHTASRGAVP